MGWTIVGIFGALIEVVLPLAAIGVILLRVVQAVHGRLKHHTN